MEKIKFITLEKLLEMKANNESFKLVEVLSEENFESGHLPDAINLPLGKLEDQAKEHLEKNETIVVYCSGYNCNASTEAVKKLQEMDYKKVLDFKAGKTSWTKAELELEK